MGVTLVVLDEFHIPLSDKGKEVTAVVVGPMKISISRVVTPLALVAVRV
jgi:hypothetical protein